MKTEGFYCVAVALVGVANRQRGKSTGAERGVLVSAELGGLAEFWNRRFTEAVVLVDWSLFGILFAGVS